MEMEDIKASRRYDAQTEIKYIGLRISYFRKMRDMTQAELAERVFINKNYLSHIESGTTSKVISLPLLINIAKVLEVDLAVLVDGNDFEKMKPSEMRAQFSEMKKMFEEMKQLNAELDKIISNMDELDRSGKN